jgi:predicted DNA-binding transcriptional regulator AlpA
MTPEAQHAGPAPLTMFPPPAVGEIRMLRLQRVREITGLSKVGVYRAMQREGFPQPVKLGIGNVRNRPSAWVESEVQAWLAEKVRSSRRKP